MRTFVRRFGAPFVLAIGGAACSAAPSNDASVTDADDAPASTAAAISVDDVCSVVNAINNSVGPIEVLPGVKVEADCDPDNGTTVHYLGSTVPSKLAASTTRSEAKAIYCAVAGADAHNANALFDTPLGKMGIKSRVDITKTDPASLHVAGQRIGTLVAFGLAMDIESQSFDFTFPTEHQPAQVVGATRMEDLGLFGSKVPIAYLQNIPEQTGQYVVLKESSHHWYLDASADIPVTGAITLNLGLDFHSSAPYDAANKRAYAMGMHPSSFDQDGPFKDLFRIEGASEKARSTSWNDLVSSYNTCLAHSTGGINVCTGPDATQQADHERNCGTSANGCTAAYYSNVGDGRLPYEGRYGASGPYVDGMTPQNWWHFGTPKDGQIIPTVPSEPVYSLVGNFGPGVPTTHFGLKVGVTGDVGFAELQGQIITNFDFRNGLAVRENQSVDPDARIHQTTNTVGTWVDSEGRAQISARFILRVNFPFVGMETVLDKSIKILDRSARSNSAAARVSSSVQWADDEPGPILDYKVGGVETPIASCLNVPAVTKPAEPVASPKDFANAVGHAVETNVFPCNIQICDPSTWKLQKCTWSTSTNRMSCTQTAAACSCADTHVDVCDAAGNVYPGTDNGGSYCSAIAACGGKRPCTTVNDCAGAGNVCDSGCCTSVK